ncbi:MAG: 23S rRNA (guanosine(2251)-2'-O)-methyltransferase RlmB [Planctomycetaceae bacterium]
MSLTLQNPHSVLAALETRPRDVIGVQLASGNAGGTWGDVVRRARESRVPVSVAKPASQSRRRRGERPADSGRSGASSSTVKPREGVSLKELFRNPGGPASASGLFLALDCLQDPRNVGAIFRTAAFFGVAGVVLTKDRSAPLHATVYDVASGGMEYVPFTVQTNLARALEAARENDLWTLGTSDRAETGFRDVPADRRWLLVLGNEEKGMRRLTAERCDMLCRIPPQSPVSSLNVSVAAGILIAHFTGT